MIAHVHDKVFSGSFYKATDEDISSGLNQFENNLGQIELNVRDILQNREKRKKVRVESCSPAFAGTPCFTISAEYICS